MRSFVHEIKFEQVMHGSLIVSLHCDLRQLDSGLISILCAKYIPTPTDKCLTFISNPLSISLSGILRYMKTFQFAVTLT